MKYRLVMIIVIVGLVMIMLFSKIQKGFVEMENTSYEDLPVAYKLSNLDSEIISKKILTRIKVLEVRSSTVRTPISVLSLDSFAIIMYRLNNIKSNSLKETIKFKNKESDRTINATYNIIESVCGGRFQYVSGKPISASNISISLFGHNIETKKYTDSLVEFNGILNNYSIKYGNEENVDLFYSNKSIIQNILKSKSSRLYFVLFQNSVILLFVHSCTENTNIPENFTTTFFRY